MNWHDFVATAFRRHKHKTAVIANLGRREADRADDTATDHQVGRPDRVERASRDSFPASDPPGWIAQSIGAQKQT